MSMDTKDFVSALKCEVVSAECSLFSGMAKFVAVTGIEGELGITSGHSPLLSSIPPGYLRIIDSKNTEQFFFVEGGFLEVQPHSVTILADTALRASDIDLEKALEAKEHAEKAISRSRAPTSIDFLKASYALLEAMAKIRVLEAYKKMKNEK